MANSCGGSSPPSRRLSKHYFLANDRVLTKIKIKTSAPWLVKMPVFLFFCVALLVALIPLLLSRWLYARRPVSSATKAPYECGFRPFADAQIPMDIQYVAIALLFLIFDLEMAFLFPWATMLRHGVSFDTLVSGLIFLLILLMGFIYEWRQGALKWQ